ncbi:MAG: hypothetical protein ACTSQE_16190 [Candidatus Heimdallarchaeaceae archaeon]
MKEVKYLQQIFIQIQMELGLLKWLNEKEGAFYPSPRKEVFGRNPKGFTLSLIDHENEAVRVTFEDSYNYALPLYFVMFDRVIEYLSANPNTVYPIGARLQPPYPTDSIEGEIWKDPKPYSTEYKSSPHVLDILYYAGYIKYAYTTDRDTGRKIQGAHYASGKPILTPTKTKTNRPKTTKPPVSDREAYLAPRRKAIQDWAEKNKYTITQNRLNYHWKNHTRLECEQLRNETSRKIIDSRIKNNGALDIETLNAVIRWGFGRDYPNQDPENAQKLTREAFNYLDQGDLVNATTTLCSEHGVGISRASKIIGLYDQENLCIYDSRVGTALKTLTHQGERMIKIPPGYSRDYDICTQQEYAQNYQWLIWVLEEIRDYMNKQGCTYRLADVEMALFMMGP